MLISPFNVPVVLIIFNRPETTELVFAEIVKIRPLKLFIIADGPRSNMPSDFHKCSEARNIVKYVNWPCELFTCFSDINLGCKNRLATGLDWVFKQVTEAIILEDDCLPDSTFFYFCKELLEYYRYDEQIMSICGTNLSENRLMKESYYFSRYPHIWGWATWRRVWEKYEVGMNNLDSLIRNENFINSFSKKAEYKFWKDIFTKVRNGEINTWDAQITYLAFTSGAYSIFPKVNLIKNIGFNIDATHTKNINSVLSKIPTHSLNFPLVHPLFRIRNYQAEDHRKFTEGVLKSYSVNTLLFKLYKKVKGIFL